MKAMEFNQHCKLGSFMQFDIHRLDGSHTKRSVGRLRAYGNAIVPQVAAEFIAASIEAIYDTHKVY